MVAMQSGFLMPNKLPDLAEREKKASASAGAGNIGLINS
jgi:hypothetical protein